MSARDLPHITLEEESHTYFVNGVVVPGVTSLLSPLHDWERVPPDVLDRKCALGRAVHRATEFDDTGSLDESSVSEEVGGYLTAWRKFRRESGFNPLHIERKVYHGEFGYAGQLDREGVYRDELTIIDIKSGAAHRAHGVQLAGYALARKYEECWATYPKRRAVYLHPDGRYEVISYTKASDYPTFVSMLTLHNWRRNA